MDHEFEGSVSKLAGGGIYSNLCVQRVLQSPIRADLISDLPLGAVIEDALVSGPCKLAPKFS